MKRQTQTTGIKHWYADDVLDLQAEGFKVLDSFFSQFGNFVISGCKVTANGARYDVSPGIIAISGSDPEGEAVKIVAPFAGATAVSLPLYLSLSASSIMREYGDSKNKQVAIDYKAVASSVVPAVPYITITASSAIRFTDVIQDSTHRFITDTERTTWNAKETTSGSQTKANTALASAKTYTDTRETAIRTDMSSGNNSTLAAAKTYTDTKEAAIRTDMTAGDTTTLATSKTYTDTREAAIRADIVSSGSGSLVEAKAYTDARETAIRTDMAAGDTTTLAAAKAYTDTKETAIRTDMAAGDTTTLATAKAYTDTKETAIRTDMTAGDNSAIAMAKSYTDTREAEIRADMADADQGALADSAVQNATVGGSYVPKNGNTLQFPAYPDIQGPVKCTTIGATSNIYYTVIGNLLLLCGVVGGQGTSTSFTITNPPASLMSKTLLTTVSSVHYNDGFSKIDKPLIARITRSQTYLTITPDQSFGDDSSINIPAMIIAFG